MPILNTTGQSGGNRQFPRQISDTKLNQDQIDHLNHRKTSDEIKKGHRKSPNQKNHVNKLLQCGILSDLHRRPNADTLENIPQNRN